MFGFRLPTRVTIAPGARHLAAEAVRATGATSALVVVDPGLAATPWPEQLLAELLAAGVRSETFAQVEPNPRTESAERAAEQARAGGLETVVGLGGGSVLDAAKAAAMLARNPGRAEDYEGRNRFSAAPLPFIALPTTCGTGSEVTWVSVLTHAASRRKLSVKGEKMFPDFALVDPDLLATLPPRLVAWTGLDALTHALEATTCTRANPVSDALAAAAIRLLLEHLEHAAMAPATEAAARAAVARASTLAGIGFGNADVAGVHCLSETLGGFYDVPHGLANAILLVPVLRYQLAANHERLAELAVELGPALVPGIDVRQPSAHRAERLLETLEAMIRRLAVPDFSSFAVPRSDFAQLAEIAAQNGSNGSNPLPMTPTDYLKLLEALSPTDQPQETTS